MFDVTRGIQSTRDEIVWKHRLSLYSRDYISETKPRKKSMRTSLVEYGDILILIENFPVECENQCLQAEI